MRAFAEPAAVPASGPERRASRRPWILSRGSAVRTVLGLCLAGLFLLVAFAAPWLAPRPSDAQEIAKRLLPPGYFASAGNGFILGSDQLGRDLLSRIVYGARISLAVSGLATLGAAVLGTSLGTLSGFRGGIVDRVLMRVVDVQMSFPYLLLAIAFMLVLPASVPSIALVLAITGWVVYARVTRVNTLALREREFVVAASAIGAAEPRILVRHVLPNLVPTIIVLATTQLAQFIIAESALSFLGLGLPPSVPSWGNMMNDGRQYLDSAWWIEVFPGLAIITATTGVGLLGDWLRDVLDPHLKV
jgi:peptide/nickel transport system permease protein